VETFIDVLGGKTWWTEVVNSPQNTGTAGAAGGTRLSIFWKRAVSAAETSPTITDTGDHQVGVIITYRGCATTGVPINITAGGVLTPAGTTITFPSVTTTVKGCLIVLAASSDTDANSTTEFSSFINAGLSNLTERIDYIGNTGRGGGFGVADGGKVVAGATGTTAVTVVSTVSAFLTIALKGPSDPSDFFLMF